MPRKPKTQPPSSANSQAWPRLSLLRTDRVRRWLEQEETLAYLEDLLDHQRASLNRLAQLSCNEKKADQLRGGIKAIELSLFLGEEVKSWQAKSNQSQEK